MANARRTISANHLLLEELVIDVNAMITLIRMLLRVAIPSQVNAPGVSTTRRDSAANAANLVTMATQLNDITAKVSMMASQVCDTSRHVSDDVL